MRARRTTIGTYHERNGPEIRIVSTNSFRNYRRLRARGVTIRKTADIIIGTFCIERGHSLLHDDGDFAPMEEHLGLRVA